jgi:hypothetical protein
MPEFLNRIFTRTANPNTGGTDRPHRLEGFTDTGAVVLSDFRGKRSAGIPDADEKGFAGGSNPMAIYRPRGAKDVSAANQVLSASSTMTCISATGTV